MTDIILESVRAFVLFGLVLFLVHTGRTRFSSVSRGWNWVVGGFFLLLFASLLDITDNFETLNRFVVIGDTETQAFLEKFVGFLGGFVVLAVGLVRWIPEELALRKLAEDDLRESESRLRSVIDGSPAAITVKDRDGRMLMFNKTYESWNNINPSDVNNIMIHDIFPKAQADDIIAKDRHVFETGETVVSEVARSFRDGSHRTVIYHKCPIRSDTGEIVAVAIILTDITERNRTVESLRESEEKFRAVVEGLSENLALYGPDDRMIICNKGYREINKAIPEATTPGTSFDDHARAMVENGLAPEGVGREEEWLRERLERHKNPKGPFELCRQDGIWLLVHDQRLPDGGTVTISTDITERKQAEEELRKAQDDLVRQERLAVLGKLSATVSHELRNPLGTIRTSITTIIGITEGKELGIEGAIGRIERNIKRCDYIIVEMLDFTRDTAPNRESTDVDDWLGGVLDEQDVPPGLSLGRDLASGVEADIDRDRLRRAVINLFDNACQAVEGNGDGADNEVVVATKVNGERVEIVVTDNGPGIADDEVGKIFEPLYSTNSFGVGLGLPVVEKIVEEHGGGVDITSTIGWGTQATLWLPLALDK